MIKSGQTPMMPNSMSNSMSNQTPAFFMESAEKCDIDVMTMGNDVKYLSQQLKYAKTPDDAFDVIMSDDFYNGVQKITTALEEYDFATIKCFVEKTNDMSPSEMKKQFCSAELFSDEYVDKANQMVEKYKELLRSIMSRLYFLSTQEKKYCGMNPQGTKKLKQLISNIASIFIDERSYLEQNCPEQTCPKQMCPEQICPENKPTGIMLNSYVSYVTIFVFILMLAIILYYVFRT